MTFSRIVISDYVFVLTRFRTQERLTLLLKPLQNLYCAFCTDEFVPGFGAGLVLA